MRFIRKFKRFVRCHLAISLALTHEPIGVSIDSSDLNKATANFAKHGVSFEDAVLAFEDEYSATFPDPDHSRGEYRYITYALLRIGRLLVVSHTERNDLVRIISARIATKKERQRYEA